MKKMLVAVAVFAFTPAVEPGRPRATAGRPQEGTLAAVTPATGIVHEQGCLTPARWHRLPAL